MTLPGDPPQRANVLLVEGLDDTLVPNHATESLAWSFGPLPHLAPVQRAVPFLDVVEGPLQGNLAADRTGAFYQYVPTGVDGIDPTPGCAVLSPTIAGEGHYCARARPIVPPARDVLHVGADGVPVIIDPLAEANSPAGMQPRGWSVTKRAREHKDLHPLFRESISTCTPTSSTRSLGSR